MAYAASLRAFEIGAENALLELKRAPDKGLQRVDWIPGECRLAPLTRMCYCYVLFQWGWVARCAGVREAGCVV